MTSNKDQLFQTRDAKPGSFEFDPHVANVFADMIARSVPGYQQILHMLPTLTRQFSQPNAHYYDLGCSLGAGLLAMHQGLIGAQAKLIGIDNSEAMLAEAAENISPAIIKGAQIELTNGDIRQYSYKNSAMILMNFTLQFIPLEDRNELIQTLYNSLLPGAVLVLSEKIRFQDTRTQTMFTQLHHQFKADQGYSQLEISRKRDAIDNVLIPESLEAHCDRLKTCGFNTVSPWVQNMQFVSILAVK